MVHINNKTLLVYAITVFTFVLFFFVTNRHKPEKEDMMNSIKEIQKVLQDQKLMHPYQPSQNKQEKIQHLGMKKNNHEDDQTADDHHQKDAKTKGELENVKIVYDQEENPSVTTSNEDGDETKQVVSSFMKFIQQQMDNMKKNIDILNDWSIYKYHSRKLLRRLNLSPDKSNIFPHVLADTITLDCKIEYDVIILVTSRARHFERRAWIRETWAASQAWSTKKNWKVIFSVDAVSDESRVLQNLSTESMKHKDLLLMDIVDEYPNLTKRLLVSLKWIHQKANTKFVFKADDTVFVHVDRILGHLGDVWSHEDYIGHVKRDQVPERDGNYGVTIKDWPGKTYDPFCKGGGFILSNSIIGKMIPHFNWVKPLKIDDAYVGHLVKLVGGRPFHAPGHFLLWNGNCGYSNELVLSNPVEEKDCADFLMSKAKIEMGKLKKGHKYEDVESLGSYREMLKKSS